MMKINVEVDCTPEEMRQFLGLPDLKPMQDAVLAQVQKQMLEATANFAPDAMLRNWLSLMPLSADQYQDMVGRMLKGGFPSAPKTG